MRTLMVRIPDELAAEIEGEARRLNLTKSAVARTRLEASRNAKGGGSELVRDLIGAEKGGPDDVSSRVGHYLKAACCGREKPRR